MFTWRVTKPKEDMTCKVIGIDLGPIRPIWWTQSKGNIEYLENGDIIVLKIPGSSQWARRGEFKYYGAYFQVLRILGPAKNMHYNEEYFECEELIDIPLRKKVDDARQLSNAWSG